MLEVKDFRYKKHIFIDVDDFHQTWNSDWHDSESIQNMRSVRSIVDAVTVPMWTARSIFDSVTDRLWTVQSIIDLISVPI